VEAREGVEECEFQSSVYRTAHSLATRVYEYLYAIHNYNPLRLYFFHLNK
jgi:hypothetical protein